METQNNVILTRWSYPSKGDRPETLSRVIVDIRRPDGSDYGIKIATYVALWSTDAGVQEKIWKSEDGGFFNDSDIYAWTPLPERAK